MKLPEKFELRMKNMLGKEYTNFIKAMEENPVYAGIRINRKKIMQKIMYCLNLENVKKFLGAVTDITLIVKMYQVITHTILQVFFTFKNPLQCQQYQQLI